MAHLSCERRVIGLTAAVNIMPPAAAGCRGSSPGCGGTRRRPHAKIDALCEQEIVELTTIIERLSTHLAPGHVASIEAKGGAASGAP
jgi:hypothetical protein